MVVGNRAGSKGRGGKPAEAEAPKGRSPTRRVKPEHAPEAVGPVTPALTPLEAETLTPLDVMLRAMREHFAAGRLEAAVAIAKEAAPYVHGKLSSSAQGAGSSLVRLEWLDPPAD